MAKSLIHISIFLASPSDLADERKAVASTVAELNSMFRTTMNVCIDLIGWETHAYPSMGIDAQDVINNQIDGGYDIFLGIMWSRFGTPTGRAGSGTEEEFNVAYKRCLEDSGKPKVMMYFNNKPIDIDLEQISKVKEFKKKTAGLGLLHWSFSNVDELVQLLKIHIPHHIKDIINEENLISSDNLLSDSNKSKIENNDNIVKSTSIDEEDDDLGYWDFMEIFHERFSEIEIVMGNMASYLNELADNMNKSTDKLGNLNIKGNIRAIEVKIIIDKFSKDIMHYVSKSKVDISRFNELYTAGIDAFTKGFYVADVAGYIKFNELEGLLNEISEASRSIKDAAKGARGFRAQIESFPPLSKSLNNATRLLDKNLDLNIKELLGCVKMLNEVAEIVEDAMDRLKKDNGEGTEAILLDQ